MRTISFTIGPVRFPVRKMVVRDVMMLDGLWLVVSCQGEDESHHSFQVSLENLSGGYLMHSDLFRSHEL